MHQNVDDNQHPSNPENPHLEHIFTFLTSWSQIENYMLQKMDEVDKQFPPSPKPQIPPGNVYANSNDNQDEQETNSSNGDDIPQTVVKGVLNGLQQRLNYPIHNRLNRQATMNTLSYLYNHMRCGIYVMIRQGKVPLFLFVS